MTAGEIALLEYFGTCVLAKSIIGLLPMTRWDMKRVLGFHPNSGWFNATLDFLVVIGLVRKDGDMYYGRAGWN